MTGPEHAAAAAAGQLADRVEDLRARGNSEYTEDARVLDRALRRVQVEAEELLADVRRDLRKQRSVL
jgi:hypothetical protein